MAFAFASDLHSSRLCIFREALLFIFAVLRPFASTVHVVYELTLYLYFYIVPVCCLGCVLCGTEPRRTHHAAGSTVEKGFVGQ